MLEETTPPLLVAINNAERLAALQQYDILDTPREVAFNDLTQLAAQICQTPVALITFVDRDRQWFKSCFGVKVTESPLEHGFCPVVVQQAEPLIISDTLADPQFATNPAVSQPGVQFYAGIPLLTVDGYAVGTICVLDFAPRQLQPEQIDSLHALSRQVMSQLELRLAARRMTQTNLALTAVSYGVAATVGETFFSSLVQHFTSALGVQYAYIGLLTDHELETIKTISVCHQGRIIDNFEYLLRDTPCQNVIQQRALCYYAQNVQAQFPDAPLLAPLQIESYAAIPILDFRGMPVGLLGVMDTKPLEAIQLAESLLTIFGVRIATEIERQHAEARQAELLAREQLARGQAEAANRIKDEFLAVLSHELRSPLNPILGWSKLLQQGRLDAAKTTTALTTIERNAQLQVQLIDDLLDISRILRGKLSLTVMPVDLGTVISEALETVRLAAEAKSIQIQTTVLPGIGIVMGDPGRLQQVVWNLLSNAVKFTPARGQVTVELISTGSNAQIQISDTGKGIKSDFLPYVFDHFRQEDGATTRKFGGLGLGLAIARQIVEMHGGTVAVDSPGEEQGATFTVRIPLAPQSIELSSPERSSALTSDLSGIHILVVDDETDSREFIAFVLEQANAKVTAVASGVDALEAFAQSIPDILISDIGMPQMDGYMLIRQIRSLTLKLGGRIPAIALTAYAGEIDQQLALCAGFQRHIAKPIDPEAVVALVAQLVKQQS